MNKSNITSPPDGIGLGIEKKYIFSGEIPGFWEKLATWLWDHLKPKFRKPKLINPNLDSNYSSLDFNYNLDPTDQEQYGNPHDTTQEYFNEIEMPWCD